MKTSDTDAMRDVACFYLSCNECEKEINCKFNITKLICKIVVHWAFGHTVLINIL